MMQTRLKCVMAISCWLLLALAGCGGNAVKPTADPVVQADPVPIATTLPGIASLGELPAAGRVAAGVTEFELLAEPPVMQSSTGVVYQSGTLELDPAGVPDGTAWAVFSLSSFPGDGSLLPHSLKVAQDNPSWIGIANYRTGAWQFQKITYMKVLYAEEPLDWLSPEGNMFVGVFASDARVVITQLQVNTDPGLVPDAPFNLSASSEYVDHIKLAWEAGEFAETFKIYRDDTSSPIASGIEQLEYLDWDVESGAPHYYWVQAVSPEGNPSSLSSHAVGQCRTYTYTGNWSQYRANP